MWYNPLVILWKASLKCNALGVLVVGLVRHIRPWEHKSAATWKDGNRIGAKGSEGIRVNKYEQLRSRQELTLIALAYGMLLLAIVSGYFLTLY